MSETLEQEQARVMMTDHINRARRTRDQVTAEEGPTWDTQELVRDFEVMGFLAPFVVVRRKLDGQTGSLLFQHDPRVYWGFQADG